MQYIIMAKLPLVKCLNTLLEPPQWMFLEIGHRTKREPGFTKESPPTSYRVTIDVTDQTLFEISSKYATSRN